MSLTEEEDLTKFSEQLAAIRAEQQIEGANVKIVSGGLAATTSVMVDGKYLNGITAIHWRCETQLDGQMVWATATIEVEGAELDIKATVPA